MRAESPLSGGERCALWLLGASAWYALVVGGIWMTWYHRPLDQLRTVEPGKIFISAMPTARGLEIAHGRHRFKTIINVFPEDTAQRSPRLPEELAFVDAVGTWEDGVVRVRTLRGLRRLARSARRCSTPQRAPRPVWL